jgi:hypothetical protein
MLQAQGGLSRADGIRLVSVSVHSPTEPLRCGRAVAASNDSVSLYTSQKWRRRPFSLANRWLSDRHASRAQARDLQNLAHQVRSTLYYLAKIQQNPNLV